MKTGQKAPDFKLSDRDGRFHSLSDYSGNWVLLYFYPKDDTPGCVKEACGIRDNFPAFKKMKAVVLGVSADSRVSHGKFSDKYGLPFVLLSDEKKSTLKKYGVWSEKKFMGRKYMGILRTSFLIDPAGKIAKIYENVRPEIHAGEVLKDIGDLNK